MRSELSTALDRELARLEVPSVLAVRATSSERFVRATRAGSFDEVDGQTQFYAASVTKQFTAALVAQFVLAASLGEATTAGEIFPELPGWAHRVTVQHLIHHTSGLPSSGLSDVALDNSAVLRRLAGLEGLTRTPGTSFAYSNVGYVLLAEVLRRTSGQSLDQLATERLTEPLGLGTADWGRRRVDTPVPRTLGDGGLWIGAEDLLRWLENLNDDVFGAEFSRLIARRGRLEDGSTIDYAWGTTRRGDVAPYFTHGGDWPGWTCKTLRQPSSGIAVALMTRGAPPEVVTDVVQGIARRAGLDA